MIKKSAFSLVGLVAVLFTGCVSTGNKLEASNIDQIKKGVTTRAEIETLLGPPMNVIMVGDGTRTMMYIFQEARLKGQTFIPIAGMFLGGANTRRQILQVILTKDNIVKDYEFNDTTGNMKVGPFNAGYTFDKTE